MTIREKISAVQDFLDWREEEGSVAPFRDDLDRWEQALLAYEREKTLARLVDDAQFLHDDDAVGALELLAQIKGLNV